MNLGFAKPSGLALSPELDGTNGRILPLRSIPRRESSSFPTLRRTIMAQATTLSPQALTNTAKALIQAYNDKNWDQARASITPDFVYDEVATGRKMTGIDETLDVWKGWAQAFPDSKGVFQNAHVAQDGTVVLELTWKGTHQGPLQTPKGPISATGKRIEIRACAIIQIAGEKARSQRHYFDMATLFQQIGVAG
jgi:steroid delta-isomerase-like uncharacterized protein